MANLTTPQGTKSETFQPAPFDHGLSVPGLYQYHAKNSPKHPVFTYSDPDTQARNDISYRKAWEIISTTATIVFDHCDKRPVTESTNTRPVIGVLALSGRSYTLASKSPLD